MKTDEVLILQALKLKQLQVDGTDLSGDLLDELVLANVPEVKEKLRNICAFISPELFNKVENLCSLLGLSKRQFVEMALCDLIEKADATLERFDAYPSGERA